MKTKTMSKLETRIRREAEITLTCEPADIPVRGNALASGDDEVDRRAEDNIIADLENGNDWAWCTVVVRGRWKGLEATDALGGCSYHNRADFTQPGGYYEDMVENVIERIIAHAEDIRS